MKIAFLGSRGIPARYSGFETFYEQLAVRLASRGHDVTVYNRSHFIKDVKGMYKGVRLVTLPSIATKHLDTITHTFLSSCHALTKRYDIAYYCIVGNAPLVWLPRLRGARTLLNVDGEDWAREKWKGFAKWYQKRSERIAARSANVIIADAGVIQDRYRKQHNVEAVFVPYGANVSRSTKTDALKKWNVTPREYVLFVGRLVPENAAEVLINAAKKLPPNMKIVIVGDAPYVNDYKRRLQSFADERVVFTGYAFGDEYAELSSNAWVYVQPSAIEGTRPAILDQMGFGNCVVVRGNCANRDVVGEAGIVFSHQNPEEDLSAVLLDLFSDPEKVAASRERAVARIRDYYNWEWIALFYEDLFQRMLAESSTISYDEFLKDRQLTVS